MKRAAERRAGRGKQGHAGRGTLYMPLVSLLSGRLQKNSGPLRWWAVAPPLRH